MSAFPTNPTSAEFYNCTLADFRAKANNICDNKEDAKLHQSYACFLKVACTCSKNEHALQPW